MEWRPCKTEAGIQIRVSTFETNNKTTTTRITQQQLQHVRRPLLSRVSTERVSEVKATSSSLLSDERWISVSSTTTTHQINFPRHWISQTQPKKDHHIKHTSVASIRRQRVSSQTKHGLDSHHLNTHMSDIGEVTSVNLLSETRTSLSSHIRIPMIHTTYTFTAVPDAARVVSPGRKTPIPVHSTQYT